VATGIQDKFSRNAVALAAIGGGVGHAGSLGIGNPALRQMAANALSQGIGVVTGVQKEFSWAGVAAAALGPMAARRAATHTHDIVLRTPGTPRVCVTTKLTLRLCAPAGEDHQFFAGRIDHEPSLGIGKHHHVVVLTNRRARAREGGRLHAERGDRFQRRWKTAARR